MRAEHTYIDQVGTDHEHVIQSGVGSVQTYGDAVERLYSGGVQIGLSIWPPNAGIRFDAS